MRLWTMMIGCGHVVRVLNDENVYRTAYLGLGFNLLSI